MPPREASLAEDAWAQEKWNVAETVFVTGVAVLCNASQNPYLCIYRGATIDAPRCPDPKLKYCQAINHVTQWRTLVGEPSPTLKTGTAHCPFCDSLDLLLCPNHNCMHVSPDWPEMGVSSTLPAP